MKYCPMKFASLANPRIINPDKIDEFLECNTTNCAWYCTYPNGEGECAIHSLPGLFDGLDNDDIIKSLTRKNPLKEVKTAKVITRTINKP